MKALWSLLNIYVLFKVYNPSPQPHNLDQYQRKILSGKLLSTWIPLWCRLWGTMLCLWYLEWRVLPGLERGPWLPRKDVPVCQGWQPDSKADRERWVTSANKKLWCFIYEFIMIFRGAKRRFLNCVKHFEILSISALILIYSEVPYRAKTICKQWHSNDADILVSQLFFTHQIRHETVLSFLELTLVHLVLYGGHCLVN